MRMLHEIGGRQNPIGANKPALAALLLLLADRLWLGRTWLGRTWLRLERRRLGTPSLVRKD
jgi:hypothetical protein